MTLYFAFTFLKEPWIMCVFVFACLESIQKLHIYAWSNQLIPNSKVVSKSGNVESTSNSIV